ncbi:MAG: sigma 54-interacting transcriptional regulator [Salinivenus sp.]
MEYAKTIALAEDLLSQGRGADVVRMIDPLLDSLDAPAADTGQIRLRALRAKVAATVDEHPAEALNVLPDRSTVSDLCTCVRADVNLWRGWAHALRNEAVGEPSQALRLLETALELHASIYNADGVCWAHLGSALAYLSIDEFALAHHALNEASSRVEALEDTLARQWEHRLRLPVLQAAGAYADAQTHLDAFRSHATDADHSAARAVASAYAASLHAAMGDAPSRILEHASHAETVLSRSPAQRSPLFLAYRALVESHLRSDAPHAAREAVRRAERIFPDGPTSALASLRARIALDTDTEAPENELKALLQSPHPLPRGLTRAGVMHLYGAVLGRQKQAEAARLWLNRAQRTARETGDRETQLQAQCAHGDIALHQNRPGLAQDLLPSSDALPPQALPLHAQRFALQGAIAQATGDTQRARSAYQIASAAATLSEDASLTRRLRSRLNTIGTPNNAEWGVLLGHAPASFRLSADLCLQALETRVSARWVGLAQSGDDDSFSIVHERGEPPSRLTPPNQSASSEDESVLWQSLLPSRNLFHLGVSFDDSSPGGSEDQRSAVQDWALPLGLILDRARRADVPPRFAPPTADPPVAIVAESRAMQSVLESIRRAAASRCPVVLTGERGTGKARLARRLHHLSARSDGPFERVVLADLQHTPPADRLFGTDDPSGETPGALHAADGGTLLIEDVETLSPATQAALLEVLDTGRTARMGSAETTTVDVRIVATTTASLDEHVRNGSFRPDLRDRLSALSVAVPPLRNRRDDIPLLVRRFLDTMRPDGAPMASITQPALEALLRYDWPGNVRQLRNEIERVLVHVSSEPTPTIEASSLLDTIVEQAQRRSPTASDSAADAVLHPNQTLSDVLSQTETDVIERVLEACDGQVTASAEVLGLTRQGLYKKMKRLGIDASEFQPEAEPASPRS